MRCIVWAVMALLVMSIAGVINGDMFAAVMFTLYSGIALFVHWFVCFLGGDEDRTRVLHEAIAANHDWHLNNDDYGGYPESDLCEQNTKALQISR